MTSVPPFDSVRQFRRLLDELPSPDCRQRQLAIERNAQLTKPEGALGRLEEIAVWYASWRQAPAARIKSPQVAVFAGTHGVARRNVSAYPPEVTLQMVENFAREGAAINQIARLAGAERVHVCAIELDRPTGDITIGPAMEETEFVDALRAGWDAVDSEADLFIPGEMGIGNSTSAAAVACALFGGPAQDWTGAGTGVAGEAYEHKVRIVERSVQANGPFPSGAGLTVLRKLGGRELAAIAGAITRARTLRIPVVLDGFICTAAAAALHCEVEGSLDHVLAGHLSEDAGHGELLSRLAKQPILELGMRLGEASGAAVAALVLKAAVECHAGMATFAEAGVAESSL